MSLQAIRAVIEQRIQSAYAVDRIPVCWDNTFETPPPLPYVICLIDYVDVAQPLVCQVEPLIEDLRGNIQISCYAKRGQGMGQLELMAETAMKAINELYQWGDAVTVKCGAVNGPVASLYGGQSKEVGRDPQALMTLSAPFVATA